MYTYIYRERERDMHIHTCVTLDYVVLDHSRTDDVPGGHDCAGLQPPGRLQPHRPRLPRAYSIMYNDMIGE